jgi:hypothetical protein
VMTSMGCRGASVEALPLYTRSEGASVEALPPGSRRLPRRLLEMEQLLPSVL